MTGNRHSDSEHRFDRREISKTAPYFPTEAPILIKKLSTSPLSGGGRHAILILMDIKRFRRLVVETIDMLPKEFQEAIENIEVIVEDWPSDEELDYFEEREGLEEGEGDDLLLGLYQGIPLHERNSVTYHGVLPDRITLFRKVIEEFCEGDEEVMVEEIRKTFLHEIGHYFGLDEERLKELGY